MCIVTMHSTLSLSVSEPHNTLDVRDDEGMSPLDTAINKLNVYDAECYFEVAHYLMGCGCDSNEERLSKLLFEVCQRGKLDIVKTLIEKYMLDAKGESKLMLMMVQV